MPSLKPSGEPAFALLRALLHILVEAVHRGREVLANLFPRGVKLVLRGGAVALELAVDLVGRVFGLLSLLRGGLAARRGGIRRARENYNVTYGTVKLLTGLLGAQINARLCLLLHSRKVATDLVGQLCSVIYVASVSGAATASS